MDGTLLHLLGYLTEKQWVDALDSCPGSHSRSRTKDLAQVVYDCFSSLGWSDKTCKKLGIKQD